MPDNSAKTVIEALLFTSEKPLTLQQIKSVLDTLDAAEIKLLLEELRSEYATNNRGMRIMEVAGGFQMVSSPGLVSFLNKLYKQRHADKLSKPALETLAIIAYKQPLTRSEIETLRNVNVDGLIKSLADKNLIRVTGRKKGPGRARVYGTTRQFLEHFGLKSLLDLPKIEELNTPNVKQELSGAKIPDLSKTEEANGIKSPAQ